MIIRNGRTWGTIIASVSLIAVMSYPGAAIADETPEPVPTVSEPTPVVDPPAESVPPVEMATEDPSPTPEEPQPVASDTPASDPVTDTPVDSPTPMPSNSGAGIPTVDDIADMIDSIGDEPVVDIPAIDPNSDGEPATIPGYTDEYLAKWEKVQTTQLALAAAKTRVETAHTRVGETGRILREAQATLSIAIGVEEEASRQLDNTARAMYQDSGVGELGTFGIILESSADNSLRALETTYMVAKASQGANTTYEDAVTAREKAEVDLAAAQFAYNEAVAELSNSIADLETARAEYKAAVRAYGEEVYFAKPQTEVGPDGCPIASPDNTLREGADVIGLRRICKQAVQQAATPQAAAAIKWGLTRLGAPYACQGVGRMDAFRFDCSSLVSRAYWDGAGIPIAGDTWAPSTRNMTPWDGVSLDRHLAFVDPASIRPGDLVLYNTCPQGGCGYRHVVMYLGSPDGGQTYWMLHTNSCGDMAHVTRFWGFGADTNFEVVRRVMTLDGETVKPATIVNPLPSADEVAADNIPSD